MRTYVDYQEDVAPTEHVLEVIEHLYTPANTRGLGDFRCKFGDGDRTVIVDLMSGSEFPDNFDFASLVGKRVKVTHTHAYQYIASDAQVIES